MWIRSIDQLTKSGAYNLNFLYKEKNVYIMDNHLAAAWAWAHEMDSTKRYKIFHIDRHYDLMYSNIEQWLEEIRSSGLDISKCSIDEYTSLQIEIPDLLDRQVQLFRWDNYLPIFLRLYPNSIDSLVFATHDDGTRDKELVIKDWCDVTIWDVPDNLSYWISREEDVRWILNLDIDFFFTGEEREFQFLTDLYIKRLCSEILKCSDKIDVITIALSPDFTGGWQEAIRISEMIAHHLGLEYRFPGTHY